MKHSKPTDERIHERDGVRDRIAALVEPAQRDVSIFAPQLDPYFFNTARFNQGLAAFATRHRQNHVRILVEDALQAIQDNDRLTGLCRRLSDIVSMRQVAEDHRGRRDMFVLVDRRGYLHQQEISRLDCLVNSAGSIETTMLAGKFEEMWERSEPITAVQPLGL
jgi:hypothetical protein